MVFYQYGGGHNWVKNCIHFLHVSEHIDLFKAINGFSSGKKRKYIGWGVLPPPVLVKDQYISFFSFEVFPNGQT